jgi:hypothetical protein
MASFTHLFASRGGGAWCGGDDDDDDDDDGRDAIIAISDMRYM